MTADCLTESEAMTIIHRAADTARANAAATAPRLLESARVPTAPSAELRDALRRDRDGEARAMADQSRAALIERAWRQSGVPERHAAAIDLRSGAAGPWLDAYRACQEILSGDGGTLIFTGARGTGKTQAAACLARDACEHGRTARYRKLWDLFREYREAMLVGGETRFIDAMVRTDLLILDECQVRRETEFEQQALTNLLDRRYDTFRSTILITNQTTVALGEALGTSVVSRICEAGGVVDFRWPSFRPQLPRRLTDG